jgi:D-beta-D-heptose 7-phosphate kinase/D-beta-D-heptose 1-phosphate adenosyltransferase
MVVGDIIVDKTKTTDVDAIDQTASIPVGRITSKSMTLGGAANCAQNLLALGVPTKLVAVAGTDIYHTALLQNWGKSIGLAAGLATIQAHGEHTPATERWVDQYGHLIARTRSAWQRVQNPLDMSRILLEAMQPPTVIVLSDYGKGALDGLAIRKTLEYARIKNIPVIIDPHPSNAEHYANFCVMTPNISEAYALAKATGCDEGDAMSLQRLLAALTQYYKCPVLVTCGRHGMLLGVVAGAYHSVSASKCHAVDTCGAGDSVVAGLAYGTYHERMQSITHFDLYRQLRYAAAVAEVSVLHPGTYHTPLHEMADVLARKDPTARIVSVDKAALLARSAQSCGETVGVANGVFDLLHAGHIQLLQGAAARCDRLIVLVNSDESAAQVKRGRPIIPQSQRVRLLAALSAVSHVVVFDGPTPEAEIETIMPNFLFKGHDFAETIADVPGSKFVYNHGGDSQAILGAITSTTNIITRIRAACTAQDSG